MLTESARVDQNPMNRISKKYIIPEGEFVEQRPSYALYTFESYNSIGCRVHTKSDLPLFYLPNSSMVFIYLRRF